MITKAHAAPAAGRPRTPLAEIANCTTNALGRVIPAPGEERPAVAAFQSSI
jgi:FXSXX-COOH protein